MSAAALAFKIVYNALYYLFYLVLLVLLVVTPADLIRQALDFHQIWIIFVIALCYLVAIVVVAVIYAIRLYVSRSAVAAIPKQWIPLDKGDMPREVRTMVAEGLSRSAAIAYAARPRIPPFGEVLPDAEGGEPTALGPEPTAHTLSRHKTKKNNRDEGMVAVTLPQYRPPWSEIEHPGWASPLSLDLTNLQYHSIMLELPNLIEAKALTLAPQDAKSQADQSMLDPEAVELLQRTEHMDLRGYLAHLTELGVLAPSATNADFITRYEAARFSGKPMSDKRFRELMHLFAEVLRAMGPMDRIEHDDEGDQASDANSWNGPLYDTDIDNDAPLATNPSTPTSRRSLHTQASQDSLRIVRRTSASTASSRLRRPGLLARNSSANTRQFRTAPTTPKSRRTAVSRSSSTDTFAQTRRPLSIGHSFSASSRSGSSGSSGSVIRLAEAADNTGLPYVLNHPHTL